MSVQPEGQMLASSQCMFSDAQCFVSLDGAWFPVADSLAVPFYTPSFADAKCFTSLDGLWFAATLPGFTPLTPLNGWTQAPNGTMPVGAVDLGGIVHLRGAIANGTDRIAFLLPPELTPKEFSSVPIDVCNGEKGSVFFDTTGLVMVSAVNGNHLSQCFSSLDGVSFVR